MSAKYKSPSFLLPNELNTSANPLNTDGNPATGTGVNSLYSMKFDGSSYIYAGSASYLNSLSQFSISVWFNLTTAANSKCIVSDWNYNTSPLGHFALQTTDSSGSNYAILLFIKRTSDVGVNFVKTSAILTENTWHHAVFTYNSGTVTCYVDGSPVSLTTTGTIPSTLTNQDGNLLIGDFAGLNRFWLGQIDEVAVFNRALDDAERAALYDGTGSNIRPSNLMASNLGPLAYYPLGEQAQNSGYPSATGNEWQFPNGVLQDYVMDFDGVNDFVDLNANNAFGFGTDDFTISMWLYRETSSYSFPYILDFRESTGSYQQNRLAIYYEESNAKLRCYINGSDAITGSTGTALPLNQWFNLILIRDSGTLSYYVNGSVDQSVSNSTDLLSTNQANLGRRYDNDRYFNGKISNLAIWNSSAANIANIYNNGSPQTSYTVTPQNWWKLNADSVYTPSAPNYTTALDFDGNSDLVNANSVINSISSSATGTVSGWIKYPTGGSNAYMITFTSNTNTSRQYLTLQETNNGLAWAQLKDRWILQTNNAVFTSGNWYHFTVTQNGTEPKIYINGTEYSNGNGATLTTYPGTDGTEWWPNLSDFNTVTIGGMIWNSGGTVYTNYGNQDLSNISIFNSALTATQISTLFNFGTPETNISFSPAAWWKLDDQNAITDSSNNGHTGTNNGATNSPGGVAVIPSWKIPNELPIQTPSYTQALDFNNGSGFTDSIAYGSSFSDVPSASGAHTFSLWFKQDALNSNGERLFATKAGHGAFTIFITNGVLQWAVYDGGSRIVSTSIQAGVWYNIIFGVNGSNETFLYLNNGSKISTAYSGTISYSSAETGVYLGRGRDAYPNRSFNGQLSNFAWFNYVLPETGTESIESIYNLGTPKDITGWSSNHLWYKLNSLTITDSSGNNRTGVNSNATLVSSDVLTTQPVNGVSTTLPSTALQQSDLQFDSPYSNYSLSFDGTSYLEIDSIGSTISAMTKISVSAWIKTTSSSGFGYILFAGRGGTGRTGYIGLAISSGAIYAVVGGQPSVSGFSELTTTATINDGNWHQLAMTFNNSNGVIQVYIDGSLDPTSSTTNLGLIPTNIIYADIAQRSYDNDFRFNGKIDETSIFNYNLSEAQVLEIYNNGKPGDLDNFSGTAPISWWRLGENAYFDNNIFTVPNSISGAPNGVGSGTVTTMLSADAPGTYANGVGDGLAVTDRVGDAPLSVANSQSYNMIPDDKVPYVPGYVGAQTNNVYSMAFDGVDDYVETDHVQGTNTNFTFSAWIKIDNTSGRKLIIGDGDSVGSTVTMRFALEVNGNNLRMFLGNGSTDDTFQVNTTNLNANQWYHICVTISGTSIKVYIGGVKKDSFTLGFSFGTAGDRGYTIGAAGDYRASVLFEGQIDEVAIFDKALTADQIKFDLYEPTATGKTADIENNTNLPTPLAWYRMGD